MATLTAGQSQSIIVAVGEKYIVSQISGETYIDGMHEQQSSYLLNNQTKSAVVAEYPVATRINIRCVSGSVNYEKVGQIATAHTLTAIDDGLTFECTNTATITVPAGLPDGFSIAVIPSGTTSIAFNGTTGNGAATTITRAAASNVMFAIQQRSTNANSYVITGA